MLYMLFKQSKLKMTDDQSKSNSFSALSFFLFVLWKKLIILQLLRGTAMEIFLRVNQSY